jgi:hypothetical protein
VKKPSATIDLRKLTTDAKELVDSMAHELEGAASDEPVTDLRWPVRFISAGAKGAPPRWVKRFLAAGPKKASTRD